MWPHQSSVSPGCVSATARDCSHPLSFLVLPVLSETAVERRRIYDIVNILESVGIVVRVAKNRYFWRGTAGLPVTLAKMQVRAPSRHPPAVVFVLFCFVFLFFPSSCWREY
mgnify:CR=1 FL=1